MCVVVVVVVVVGVEIYLHGGFYIHLLQSKLIINNVVNRLFSVINLDDKVQMINIKLIIND